MVRLLVLWSLLGSLASAGETLDEFLNGSPPTPVTQKPPPHRGAHGAEQPEGRQPGEPRERPVVDIYTATWCGPCRGLKAEIGDGKDLPFRVRWHDVDREEFPADVPAEIPHAEWGDRRWYAKPDNLKDLVGKFERNQEPKPKGATPVNPVPGRATVAPAPSGQQWNGKARKGWKRNR